VNVVDIADELADKLEVISGLRVYRFLPDQVSAPAAIVGYPQTIDFDTSYGRGVDMITMPVYVLIDRTWDRSTAERFSGLTAGSGASSVKAALEAKPNLVYSTARVRQADFSVITVSGLFYWVATFLVDITGSGA